MNKKKLIISIASLCLVVVAAVAAVVGVLAASQQVVRSTVSVRYRANNVKATVTMSYRSEKDGAFTTAAGANETLSQTFRVTEGSTTKDLVTNQTVLGGRRVSDAAWSFERYVIYRFVIHNDYAAAEGRQITSTLTYNPGTANATNVLVAWKATTSTSAAELPEDVTVYEHFEEDVQATWPTKDSSNQDIASTDAFSTTAPSSAITINQNEYVIYYMVVAISNVTLDANYSTANITAGSAASLTNDTIVFTLNTVTNSGDAGDLQ